MNKELKRKYGALFFKDMLNKASDKEFIQLLEEYKNNEFEVKNEQ
jgi:hypothetical protein